MLNLPNRSVSDPCGVRSEHGPEGTMPAMIEFDGNCLFIHRTVGGILDSCGFAQLPGGIGTLLIV